MTRSRLEFVIGFDSCACNIVSTLLPRIGRDMVLVQSGVHLFTARADSGSVRGVNKKALASKDIDLGPIGIDAHLMVKNEHGSSHT